MLASVWSSRAYMDCGKNQGTEAFVGFPVIPGTYRWRRERRSNESRKRPIHAGFADSNFLHTLNQRRRESAIGRRAGRS